MCLKKMICVIIESPYANSDENIRKENIKYAVLAMQDSLKRGEAPFLSHLLYTQTVEGFVGDDNKEKECIGRDRAINAGLAWGKKADKTVVYTDRGISNGMKYGIKNAIMASRPVEYRTIL